MSYLKNNNNKVVVDAILTSYGKNKLASKGTLDIVKFAVADDEIDYALYNNLHVQGSDYYNSAIINLPILQALPENYLSMKYPLFSSTTGVLDAITQMRLNISAEMTASGIINFTVYPITPSFNPEPGDITRLYYVGKITIPNAVQPPGGEIEPEPITLPPVTLPPGEALSRAIGGGGGGALSRPIGSGEQGETQGATSNGAKFQLRATINESIGMTNQIIAARGFYLDTTKYKYAVGHGFTFQVTRFGRDTIYLPMTVTAFGINARPVDVTIRVNGRAIAQEEKNVKTQAVD